MVLMIDNYDSFTYNLVQYLGELGAQVQVVRNDELSVAEAVALKPERVVISPGPCTPNEAGISVPLIQALAGQVPILGVCLGHQSIVSVFGGKIISAAELMHGKTSMVAHDGQGVFKGLPDPMEVGRYHSLAAESVSMPDELVVTARTDEGEIMGARHRDLKVEGVQFHPESVLTPDGLALMKNFLEMSVE